MKILKKINLDGFIELSMFHICDECGCGILLWDNIIGYGNYTIGGYKNLMKSNNTLGIGVLCPKCFAKLVYHAKMKYIEYIDTWMFNKSKRD